MLSVCRQDADVLVDERRPRFDLNPNQNTRGSSCDDYFDEPVNADISKRDLSEDLSRTAATPADVQDPEVSNEGIRRNSGHCSLFNLPLLSCARIPKTEGPLRQLDG
jgi:hypothetical protein